MIDHEIQSALEHHRTGRLESAETAYRRILSEQPSHLAALHMMGVLAIQTGRYEVAVALLARATAAHPDAEWLFNDLASALWRAGRLDEAIAACREGLRLRPQYPEALNNLGVMLSESAHSMDAEEPLREAVRLEPDYVEAYFNLGNALVAGGKLEEAVETYRRALQVEPSRREDGGGARVDEAREDDTFLSCLRAPGRVQLQSRLAAALADCWRLDEAIVAHREAIRIDPGFAEAHYKYGVALLEADHFAEAIAAFDKVLELDAGETGELANTASLRTLCEISQRAGILPDDAQIAVAMNVSREPLMQLRECFNRLAENLPRAKVAIFLDGVTRPEVVDLANEFRFTSRVETKLGTNATWNLWWLRMLRFFAETEADVCFKVDPDTMVDGAPKAILDADYFGHVCAEYVQGGVTGISRALVRTVLERKLLEPSGEEPRPWLESFSDPRYIDDQMIARVFAHVGVRPVKWRECRSIWRWPVPNDPVTHAIVHPRYYGMPGNVV